MHSEWAKLFTSCKLLCGFKDSNNLLADGNMLINKLCGARLYSIPKKSQSSLASYYIPKMEQLAAKLKLVLSLLVHYG